MATFTNLENAHVFSKAVITPSMSASAAGNTSAHTIQSKDTWAEAVPFLEKSDLSGVSADKEFNIEGYGTVKFHYKKNVYCLINSNNNDIPSNGYVGKIIDSEGNTISQFISPTDVVNDAGQMATVYQPSLYDSKGESMPLSDYIINPSNGLIYDLKSTGNQGIFATSAADGRTEYKLSFFTYEGAKLDTTITNIKSSINETKDDLSSHASDTDVHITADERSKWNSAVQDVTSGNAYLERGTDDDNITLTLNVDTNLNDGATTNSVPSSVAVTSYGSSIISAHEAKKDGNQSIHVTEADRSSWDTAATKAGTAIQTVKRANDSSTLITVDQSETSVSITLSDTIATKDDTTNLENLIKNKVEALPSVYTGDNVFYVNCYGFEYTNPSENIIFDKIEIKFAKNLNTLTEFKPGNAPEISPLEIENNICKIVVVKVLTPPSGVYEQPPASDEIEIATSNYNTGVSKEDNLIAYPSQFKFSENILLEEGWNYRFYFYDKNDNLFPASVIVNFISNGDTTLKQSSVANRYLSDRYGYWGVHGVKQDNETKILNGLGIKLINSLQEHVNNKDIHVTLDDKNNWNSWENAISEEKYTITEYDKISGNYTTFVLPYNIVPVGSSINTVKLEITKGTPDTSAYLGAGLLFTDGSTKLLRVSNNAESISSRGILTWYFDEALELEENSRFVFYLLKNKEDFISPHPLVSSDVRICSRAARVVPGSDYSSWNNVISNLNYGFISDAANLEAGNYNSMWDEYPVCTLSKIHHVNNDIRHFKEGEHEQLFSDDERLFATTEEFSTLEENINDINNEIEAYNYSVAQSIETGTISGTNNTRGFGTLIANNITLGKVITYCHSTNGAENSNIWLKVFEKTSAPHIFKGISDTSLNHKHGATLEYTFKNSNIKLEANKEYFFVFCPENQKNSTTFQNSGDSIDCCIQTVSNTTGHGGVCGPSGISNINYIALHKIYKKPGKFAFATDLEEHTSDNIIHLTPEEKTTVISLKSTNINNLYNKTDNVATVSNKTIAFSDGSTAEFESENIISAQYAFRTTSFRGEDTDDSNAPNANSKLTAFNLRTIYTSTNGATTEGGRIDVISDGIELYKGNDGYYYYRGSDPVEYEQDLLWKDDEEYETLGSLINGTGMFMRNKIEVFNDDLTCLTTAKGMFGTNRQLADFKSPLPSLVNAKSMFTGCRKLKNWRIKLPSLVIGTNMFSDVNYKMELQSVDTCLPNLTVARQMFAGCFNLTSFHVPSTSFSNLYDAREMFIGCPITSINGNFESLEDGTNMLPNAHLDLASIQNIAKTIRNWSNGYPAGTNEDGSLKTVVPTISLGIGLDYVEGDSNVIAVEAELDKIREKGWNVPVIWNGPSTISTLDETNKTFFARLCDSGAFNTHIDENGKPCSIITTDSLMWISDKDSWSQMVSSLEEAEAYFKLTKIEKVEESTDEII